MELRVARTRRQRLLGLALAEASSEPFLLLLPRCRSVHTFGMRYPLDLLFLDAEGRALAWREGVPPRRVVSCRGAAAVLEAPAEKPGVREMIAAVAQERNRLLVALDPRVPIYRDSYNEYFVFIRSAGGAAAGTQVPLYIVMAITELWHVIPFVLACVVFELVVIFGLARPQMKAVERLGWVVLWSAATAGMALCFYYLVAEPTLG